MNPVIKQFKFGQSTVTLETGRRNQIRVHFAEAGHPVIGDDKYEPAAARHRSSRPQNSTAAAPPVECPNTPAVERSKRPSNACPSALFHVSIWSNAWPISAAHTPIRVLLVCGGSPTPENTSGV